MHETDEGEHGRGEEKRVEDPARAGPQGACLMTGQVTGQPGKRRPRGSWEGMTGAVPGQESLSRKREEQCQMPQRRQFRKRVGSVQWIRKQCFWFPH